MWKVSYGFACDNASFSLWHNCHEEIRINNIAS